VHLYSAFSCDYYLQPEKPRATQFAHAVGARRQYHVTASRPRDDHTYPRIKEACSSSVSSRFLLVRASCNLSPVVSSRSMPQSGMS
jgi:hypothetical protein